MKRILPWVMSVLLAFTCLNISPSSAAADNLVVNGSFEEPVLNGDYGTVDFQPSFKGWDLSKGYLMEIDRETREDLIPYLPPESVIPKAKDGKQYVQLDSIQQVTQIYQDITTEAGQTYELTFSFSPRPYVSDNKLNVKWGDTEIVKLEASGEGLSQSNWQDYSYGVQADSSTTRLSFDNIGEFPDSKGSYVDAIGLEPLVCKLGDEKCQIIITPDEKFLLPVTIPIPEDSGTLPLDLMLTQDVTGSYRDDLPVLRALIPDLVEELRALQPDTTFGLATFQDNNPGEYVYRTELPLTTDSAAFEAAVDKLTANGGCDYPESSLTALMQVAVRAESELNFRQNTRRVAIVSTDATYKKAGDPPGGTPNNGDAVLDPGEDFPSVPQVKQAINEANVVPIFLATTNVVSTYNDLVSQLGVGAVVELEADSSNLIEALKEALEVINQNLTIVAVNDDYGYVESIEPDRFEDVAPGSEVTTNITFKYSGLGTGDEVTIRALGIGDLVVDVQVSL
ncbi:DUF642 domain-containing protein [Okeania sp. SIO1I7]|uniref:DUF642 domain-containing protein n=1 Tax=Okeania sp. SIO1I7 TaxID=2607772 RepID=UPI0013F9F6BA|nr:DUF642 domain-containing protein [Okeania sp. SIO1I7]NET27384.1 DUF642 domain-containing protein [Okeania sp. SIO1I7]